MQGRVVGYRELLQLNRQKLCFGILFIKFITKHSFGSSLVGTSRFFPLNSLARTRSPSVVANASPRGLSRRPGSKNQWRLRLQKGTKSITNKTRKIGLDLGQLSGC